MNPARTIGTLIGGGQATTGLWANHWVYWIGPILGAVLGAFAYEAMILRREKSTG
jgi:glycerol uptake facilitator-like aquaporin